LHLQLDLMDLQFVDKALRVGVGQGLARSRGLLPQSLFGAAPQFGGSRWEGVRFLLHAGVLVTDY
jgi:hypothetical protein